MKKGFTLSEVLITLGIIGVVAAMTIPVFVKKYQQHVTVTKLKKVYTILNQAFKMSEIDNDSYENWDNINDIGREAYIEKYWRPYLKVIKTCNTDTECGYIKKEGYYWRNANNTTYAQKGMNEYNLIINDGVFIMFGGDFRIYIDLNAGQTPNRYGHDFFIFSVTNKGVYPNGYPSTSYCNKTSNYGSNGEFCASKIMVDGWKIKDDYPW